jgi:hypothetical protein
MLFLVTLVICQPGVFKKKGYQKLITFFKNQFVQVTTPDELLQLGKHQRKRHNQCKPQDQSRKYHLP